MGRHARPAPRRRLVAAVLGLAVVAELGVATALVANRRRDSARPFSTPTADPSATALAARADFLARRAERHQAVVQLLERRAGALLRRDRAAFLATVDPQNPSARRKQAALFDNLRQVPLGVWRYRVDADRETDPGSPYVAKHRALETYLPEVRLEYALKDFDPAPTAVRQQLTFVRRETGWFLAADDDFAGVSGVEGEPELWDRGPVEVARTEHVLVLGRPQRRSLLRTLATITEATIPQVNAGWGTDWSQRVVVVVPESQAELGLLIGEGNDLSQIAAVATARLALDAPTRTIVGNRIVVNPPNITSLSGLGRRVVLQHEVTHVASRALTGPHVPLWLVEGFADYVGYQGSNVSVRLAARSLAKDVRAGRVPASLPGNEEFNGLNPRLAQAYEGSWLACRLIAETVGADALVRFYRGLGRLTDGSDEAVRAVWRDTLRTTPESFTKAWQAYLRGQLG